MERFKTVTSVKTSPSEKARTYVLLKGAMVETDDVGPYIVERFRIRMALTDPTIQSLPYGIGLDSMYSVSVEDKGTSISLGCQLFTGLDAKRLRRWALGRA